MTSVSSSMNRLVLWQHAKGEGIWYGSIESWAAKVKKGQIFIIAYKAYKDEGDQMELLS